MREVLRRYQRTKRAVEREVDGDTNSKWHTSNVPRRHGKRYEELEIGRRIVTIETTALLGSARILRKVLVTFGDLLLLKLHWKIIVQLCCEKLTKSNIIKNIQLVKEKRKIVQLVKKKSNRFIKQRDFTQKETDTKD